MAGIASRRTRFALAASAVCLTAPAIASAEIQDTTPAEAAVQLAEAEQAIVGEPGLDPTTELIDLAVVVDDLDGAERRRARAILARPPADEGEFPEGFGAEWSQAATKTEQTYASPGGQFLIHWVEITEDAPDIETDDAPANGVPDYVDKVAAAADLSAAVQNDELVWPPPKPDGTRGGDARTDIYLSDICNQGGCVFGYAGPDDASGQCTQPPFQCFAYLVLDNDYLDPQFGPPSAEKAQGFLEVTMAHEYNHVLQFRLDALQDQWMFESTAVWAEEQVFADVNDWLNYIPAWSRGSTRPLTSAAAGGGIRIYGSAVWQHWLDVGAGYGPDIVLSAWERSRQGMPKDFGVGAFDRAIKAAGPANFSKEFTRFAAATAEWRAGDDFPDATELSDVRRSGKVRRRARRVSLDHTAYRLLRVNAQGPGRLRLRVKAPRGVRTGIGLVGRSEDGVVTRTEYLRRGGKGGIGLANAGSYDRLTAVLVNADGRVRGFSSGRGDWLYEADNERFAVRLRR